jgi:hypothetical protein
MSPTLVVGFGWNKASCRPLHGFRYRMGIAEIISCAPAETASHTWPEPASHHAQAR